MSDGGRAVFLSYASQDADAARRICEALRAAGVDVWFDQSELRGGDAWDAKIHRQIKECALFVPVISASTQSRTEGYFRREWRLAVERTKDMADYLPFLVPVVIDETVDAAALVPEKFRDVQWVRLSRPLALEAMVEQVRQLLGQSSDAAAPTEPAWQARGMTLRTSGATAKRSRLGPILVLGAVVVSASLWVFMRRAPARVKLPVAPATPITASSPIEAEKSLVVLPFENLSAERDNQSVVEAMHSGIIATLTELTDLKVISRTSANALRGSTASLAELATKVGVAHVVAGTVQRTGNAMKVRLELRRARDEALLWGQSFEGELGNLGDIDNRIAQELARVLEAKERKGNLRNPRAWTKNPEALKMFGEASRRFRSRFTEGYGDSIDAAIEAAEKAMEFDPEYLSAASFLVTLHVTGFLQRTDPVQMARHAARAKHWVDVASRLMPGAAADAERGYYLLRVERDAARAFGVLQKAVLAFPNDSSANNRLALAMVDLGRASEAVAVFERALELDPLNATIYQNHIGNLARLRRPVETAAALERYRSIRPGRFSRNVVATHHFLSLGEVPADLSGMAPTLHVNWLWKAGRFAEIIKFVDDQLRRPETNDVDRFFLRWREYSAAKALNQIPAATAAHADLQEVEQRLRRVPEMDATEKLFRGAVAGLCAGRTDEGFTMAKRWAENVVATSHPHERWERDAQLAAFYAEYGQADNSVAMLARLLRVPSGVTVPALRTSPDWKNLREHRGFKALLADPKNAAPL